MYKQLLLLTTGLVLSFSALAGNQYSLGVKGVACPYCAFGIEKRLNKVDGVTDVKVDIGASRVRVSMADGATLTEAKARQAVKEAGFTLRSFARSESAQDAHANQ